MHPFLMHPSEMKNQALVAAAKAERDGFSGTAEALTFLAQACADEARELLRQTSASDSLDRFRAAHDRGRVLNFVH